VIPHEVSDGIFAKAGDCKMICSSHCPFFPPLLYSIYCEFKIHKDSYGLINEQPGFYHPLWQPEALARHTPES
jgi:hypothetical protein